MPTFPPEFVPENRNQCLSLLRAVDDDPTLLTESQRQAIRKQYFIDGDQRSVEQRVKDGEVQA